MAVTVVVDYGQTGREPITEQTMLPAGASPIEALAEVASVDRRFVTRTAGDVYAVEGIATDEDAGLFWVWRLNGRRPAQAPDRYEVQNGDQITWKYIGTERPEYER